MAKTRYLETCQLRQLLDALDGSDELEFPVCVEYCDKPDFVLSTRLRRIGLEVSSLMDEEVRRAEHLAIAQFPNAFIPNAFTTNKAFQQAERRPSNEQVIDEMFNWETRGQDIIEATEHRWQRIVAIAQVKRRKFRSQCFEKFDENWLMLSDYPNPFYDPIGEDVLSTHFRAACQRSDVFGTEFDRICIFHGPKCFRLKRAKLASELDRKSP